MFYIQIAAAVVSILLGLTQITKEGVPFVCKIQENQRQMNVRRKADIIASMNIAWQFQGCDGTWRYYSDPSQTYWCRVNVQGIHEYSERPQMAHNPIVMR